MEEKKLNEQESLALIASMIDDTRKRLATNSGRPFLVWGYTTVLVSLFEYMTYILGWSKEWGLAWWLIPIIGYALTWLTCRKKQHTPKSYVDRCIDAVWCVLGATCFIVVFGNIMYGLHTMLFFSVVLTIGSGIAITGLIIKDLTSALGGCAGMVASLVFPIMRQLQPTVEEVGNEGVIHYILADILIFAAIFFVMLVIPGHILNFKNRKNKACSKR